jgi:hypothetical protein
MTFGRYLGCVCAAELGDILLRSNRTNHLSSIGCEELCRLAVDADRFGLSDQGCLCLGSLQASQVSCMTLWETSLTQYLKEGHGKLQRYLFWHAR